jgi:hypothetical protein
MMRNLIKLIIRFRGEFNTVVSKELAALTFRVCEVQEE